LLQQNKYGLHASSSGEIDCFVCPLPQPNKYRLLDASSGEICYLLFVCWQRGSVSRLTSNASTHGKLSKNTSNSRRPRLRAQTQLGPSRDAAGPSRRKTTYIFRRLSRRPAAATCRRIRCCSAASATSPDSLGCVPVATTSEVKLPSVPSAYSFTGADSAEAAGNFATVLAEESG